MPLARTAQLPHPLYGLRLALGLGLLALAGCVEDGGRDPNLSAGDGMSPGETETTFRTNAQIEDGILCQPRPAG